MVRSPVSCVISLLLLLYWWLQGTEAGGLCAVCAARWDQGCCAQPVDCEGRGEPE